MQLVTVMHDEVVVQIGHKVTTEYYNIVLVWVDHCLIQPVMENPVKLV